MKLSKKKFAMVLSGGGARGAYQVGVMKALYSICEEISVPWPFRIYAGTSVGSINATYLAANAHNPKLAIRKINRMWGNLTSDQVYQVDGYHLLKSAIKLAFQSATGGLSGEDKQRSLLETDPLRQLIERQISFKNIQKNIDKGIIDSLAVTALNYAGGNSHTFFAGDKNLAWQRHERLGICHDITASHVMASTAIPILFPPVQVEDQYYGDGNMRNYTPFSPAIRLGGEKLFVIGVKKYSPKISLHASGVPSPAKILGVLLNSVLLDAIDLDYERLSRVNESVDNFKSGANSELKKVDMFLVRPSQDISKIAFVESMHLPKLMRYFVRGLGTQREASDVISYLLFEPSFTNRLMALGHKDLMAQKEEAIAFLTS